MAKIIDKISFTIAFCVIIYSALSRYLQPWSTVMVTTISYLIAVFILFIRSIKRPSDNKITPSELPLYFALMDRKAQTTHFYNLIPDDMKIKMNSPYFFYQIDGKKKMVAVLYRFINLTQEDIASAYREGKNESVNEIIMLTRHRERKTLTLCAFLDIPFKFPDKYTVHRVLKKHNALIVKPIVPYKNTHRSRDEWRIAFENVFEPKKVKLYLSIAVILAICSLITPLKVYYLVCAGIPLSLGTIGLIKNAKT